MVWGPGRGAYERSLPRGRGSLGVLGSCLAVHPLRVLPETLTLSLQCPQLLHGLVAGACRAPELALWRGDSEDLQPGMGSSEGCHSVPAGPRWKHSACAAGPRPGSWC